MAVSLRLQRHGRKKIPYYWIIAVDGRKKRDGAYLERIGSYNPLTVPAEIEIDTDRALYWLENGAQPSDTVHAILKYKGIMHRKHLLRGVKMGIITQEQADAKWQEHVDKKQEQIVERLRNIDKKQKEERDKRVKAETAKKEAMLERRAKKLEAAAKAAAAPPPADAEGAAEEGPKTIDDVAREAAIERGEMTAEEAAVGTPRAEAPEAPVAETPAEEPVAEKPEEPAAEAPTEEPKE
jgi:small subunit ribosomal protein S16